MQFLSTIYKSIYNRAFYRGLLERPFAASLKYFFKLILLLTVVGALGLIARGVVPSTKTIRNEVDNLVALYPENLVITIKAGQALSNAQEPFAIALPNKWRPGFKRSGETTSTLENLLVINTAQPFNLENFAKYHTLALLTKDTLAVENNNQGLRVFPLAKAPDTEITRQKIQGGVAALKPYLPFIPPLFTLLLLIGVFIALAFTLLSLLLEALLIWGLLALMRLRVTYKKAYQLGLHAVTAGLLLDTLLNIVVPQLRIPLIFTALMLMVVILNLWPTKQPASG